MLRRKRSARSGARKMASIYDVAKAARVSVFTVSAVVNKKSHVAALLRRRVEAAIEKLNYRPNLLARSFAKRQTHTIGLVVPDIANPFFPALIRGAEDAAHKRGYNILLCNSDDNLEKEQASLELLLSKRVDGILLTKTPGPLNPSLRKMMDDFQVPFVLLMRTYPSISKDAVITDDYNGAFEAVSQLARVGHRRIAMVGGPLTVSNGRARCKGFQDGLKAHGLTFDPSLVYEGDYRTESGYHAGHTLLGRKPDGVYVANYLMTVGFLRAAEEMGMRCPQNFGLISFDDYPWLDFFRPPLSTVELPKYQVGYEAAELVMERIAGKRGPGVVIKLPTQLRVRESCGFASQMRRSAPAASRTPQASLTRSE